LNQILVLIILFIVCIGQSMPSPEKLIREVFESYRQALIDKDGDKAWYYIDSQTINFFEDLRNKSLTLSYEDMNGLDVMKKFIILRLRNDFNKKQLETMNPKDIFVAGVERGYISNDTIKDIKLNKIEVQGNIASGFVSQAPKIPSFYFAEANGIWKVALVKNMDMGNAFFEKMLDQSGMTEKEFLIDLLSQVSSSEVKKGIFDKPK